MSKFATVRKVNRTLTFNIFLHNGNARFWTSTEGTTDGGKRIPKASEALEAQGHIRKKSFFSYAFSYAKSQRPQRPQRPRTCFFFRRETNISFEVVN